MRIFMRILHNLQQPLYQFFRTCFLLSNQVIQLLRILINNIPIPIPINTIEPRKKVNLIGPSSNISVPMKLDRRRCLVIFPITTSQMCDIQSPDQRQQIQH